MLSSEFARILAAGRPHFNRRVAEARRRSPSFDQEAFGVFLQAGVDGVVVAAARVDPERVGRVALAAFDVALELVGQALAGPRGRSAMLGRVWSELLPLYARLLVAEPVEVMGTLSNAVLNLENSAGVRAAQWLAEMTAMAPRVDSVAQLRAVGQIQAWRAGMAHFRRGAIAAADALPAPLALTAFSAERGGAQEGAEEGARDGDRWPLIRDRLLADPWWRPDAGYAREGGEVGRFTGFGGAFFAPPEARACEQGFFVRSADRYSLLVADAYGAVLHAATAEEFDAASGARPGAGISLNGTRLTVRQRQIDLDLPADGIALSCNAHTLAVTSPYTHAIRLLPL